MDSKYGTDYIETEIILAAQSEDEKYLDAKLEELLLGEMMNLHTAVIFLEERIHALGLRQRAEEYAKKICSIEGVHHHQIASGMSIQFQPGHPMSDVPDRYR